MAARIQKGYLQRWLFCFDFSFVTIYGEVVESFDAAISLGVTVSGDTLTIDSTSNLPPYTHCFVTIAEETIRDFSGKSYSGKECYDFTTGTAVHDFEGAVIFWKSSVAIAGVTEWLTDRQSCQKTQFPG